MTCKANNNPQFSSLFCQTIIPCCLMVIFLSLSLTLDAAQDVYQALSIAATSAEIDEPNGWARYSGDVELKQGSLLIQCDQLDIFRSAQGVDRVIATGSPASYSQDLTSKKLNSNKNDDQNDSASNKSIKAQANQLTYTLESKSIELQGNAKIQQGDNLFEGHTIVYQIDNRKIMARSNKTTDPNKKPQRVKIVLPVRQPK